MPQREIYSGLAETIKHACLADAAFFDYLEAHMDEILEIDQEACEHIAEKNCSIKYHVVMQDERELGLREVLNLGHTVGRAVETVSDYRLLHGEAFLSVWWLRRVWHRTWDICQKQMLSV